MYKVFFNDRYIELSDSYDTNLWKKYNFVHFFSDAITLKNTIETFEKSSMQSLLIIYEDVELLKNLFLSNFMILMAGGGIVFNEKYEVLLIYRRDKWDLPKGKADNGETIRDTALREVREEVGLKKLSITEEIGSTYHSYRMGTEKVLKETVWFKMFAPSDQQLIPQTKEDITRAVWVQQSELEKYLQISYEAVRDLFRMKNLI